MYLAGAFVILALAGIGSGTPLCDPQTFMPCITPVVAYFMSPEGQPLAQLEDVSVITETQVVSVCRQVRTAFQCVTGAVERCIPSDLTELREFMTGVNSLLNVCDRPDLYSKTRLVLQCDKILNETRGSKSRGCANMAIREAMADIKGQVSHNRSDTIKQLRNWGIMKELCCDIQYYDTCSGTEVADKCGAETQRIEDDIQHALMTTFNCNGARVANCPARAPPTEEDANVDIEVALTQLMESIFGTGGPPA